MACNIPADDPHTAHICLATTAERAEQLHPRAFSELLKPEALLRVIPCPSLKTSRAEIQLPNTFSADPA